MPIMRTPWSGEELPDAGALLATLRATGRDYTVWGNAPGDIYAVHTHTYDKHLVCLRGSIRFTLPATSEAADLSAGDELYLPAHTPHGAIVGPHGVQCAEAHLSPR